MSQRLGQAGGNPDDYVCRPVSSVPSAKWLSKSRAVTTGLAAAGGRGGMWESVSGKS